MADLPRKSLERITTGLKKFQPILAAAKSRDVNESDTVVIVTDILHEVFGYDKYSEITSEYMIRSTFCDLAIKLDGHLAFLIEVKAIGLELKENFVKQAVDYAANQGVEWVVLTNAAFWRIYKVMFSKPIEHELVVEFDLPSINPRNTGQVEVLGLLAKDGWQKARLGDYQLQRQALNRFTLGALLLSDPVIEVIRREIRRVSSGLKIEADEIRKAIQEDVIKRDVLEGDKAALAKKAIAKAAGRTLRTTQAASRSEAVSSEDSSAKLELGHEDKPD